MGTDESLTSTSLIQMICFASGDGSSLGRIATRRRKNMSYLPFILLVIHNLHTFNMDGRMNSVLQMLHYWRLSAAGPRHVQVPHLLILLYW